MKYKIGKIREIYNKEANKRIDLIKTKKGYRVTCYHKKQNTWTILNSRDAPYKKYAERRTFDFLEKYF